MARLASAALVAVTLVSCEPPPAPDPPAPDPVEAILGQLSLEEKVALMAGTSLGPNPEGLWLTPGVERLGWPGFAMVDGPRGLAAGEATAFPVGMARGATWDVALEAEVGRAIGAEARAQGANVLLAPVVNVLRHPAWGRAQETYGEDPHHLGAMGVAFVDGAQEHVVASTKHFVANSIEDTRAEVDVTLSERVLREVYLPAFRDVVDADVGSVMTAYNSVNGSFCSENEHLLRDVLKGEWGFAGFVESDWLFGTHDTVRAAAAGLDIEMPLAQIYGDDLLDAVLAGDVSEADVDDAARRIIGTWVRFGLDDLQPLPADTIASPEHRDLARRVAEQGTVLLRNEGGALPLPGGTTVAVVGRLADQVNLGDHGSSDVDAPWSSTPWDELSKTFPVSVHVDHDVLDATDLDAIGSADAAVLFVGLTHEDEGEAISEDVGGDRDDLGLSERHVALIQAAAAANDRTIVVVEAGSAITMPWLDDVEAVLMAWYPGMEGGAALAGLISGAVAPSGRLPISFPVSADQLPPFDHTSLSVEYGLLHGYRHLDAVGASPLFPFGFGLTWTTFAYTDLEVVVAGDELRASFTVRNTGERAGAAVPQLYVGALAPPVERPPRELEAFDRVLLEAGAAAEVTLAVPLSRLARWDDGWVLDPGAYRVEVGPDAAALPLQQTIDLP